MAKRVVKKPVDPAPNFDPAPVSPANSQQGRKHTGRPRVLDEGKQREICAILTVGCSRATAAQYVGCHPDTIRKTALRDELFAVALERAESSHEIAHLTHINKAAQEGRYWRAAAWALERQYPDRYAPRAAGAITLEQVSQIMAQLADIVLEEVSDDDCRERILDRLSLLTEPEPDDENSETLDSDAEEDAEDDEP